MALTEEEKKKQAQLSQQQASKESALDSMYNENKAFLEKQKQLKMEDAYVNQELMNKYLNESLAQQGLDQSGVANLYKQQLNTDYMNTRANIANQYTQDQLALLNEYNADKKAETDKYQKANYDIAVDKINNSVNKQGFIDADTMAALNLYIDENSDKFGENYKTLLQSQLDLYSGNEEQINAYNQDNYQSYLDDLYTKIGDAQSITDEEYDTLVSELDTVKGKIGEANYTNALQTLSAYKTVGDIIEKLDETQRLSSADYEQLKSSLTELKDKGIITSAVYNDLIKSMDQVKLSKEEEKERANQALQKGLNENYYGIWEDIEKQNEKAYWENSDDAALEKVVRIAGSRISKGFKDIGKTISGIWKNLIWD